MSFAGRGLTHLTVGWGLHLFRAAERGELGTKEGILAVPMRLVRDQAPVGATSVKSGRRKGKRASNIALLACLPFAYPVRRAHRRRTGATHSSRVSSVPRPADKASKSPVKARKKFLSKKARESLKFQRLAKAGAKRLPRGSALVRDRCRCLQMAATYGSRYDSRGRSVYSGSCGRRGCHGRWVTTAQIVGFPEVGIRSPDSSRSYVVKSPFQGMTRTSWLWDLTSVARWEGLALLPVRVSKPLAGVANGEGTSSHREAAPSRPTRHVSFTGVPFWKK